jgi:hypothetical protein
MAYVILGNKNYEKHKKIYKLKNLICPGNGRKNGEKYNRQKQKNICLDQNCPIFSKKFIIFFGVFWTLFASSHMVFTHKVFKYPYYSSWWMVGTPHFFLKNAKKNVENTIANKHLQKIGGQKKNH